MNQVMTRLWTIGWYVGLLLLPAGLLAQGGQVRGTVVNQDGDPLTGATVFIPALKTGAYANEDGIYSIARVPAGTYQVMAFYYGYDTVRKEVTILAGGVTTTGFTLSELQVFADAVEITGERPTGQIQKTQVDVGVTSITPQEIQVIPSLGAPDLAQYLQVLPGVVFTGDQGGQLFIRGGTPIQNMVLMDEMVVYSPFHSIGLFSVFDPDFIRSVDVYSAAFPGQYGGRVSSVIDIKTRNGSFDRFKAKVNLNPFTGGLLLEGPLKRSSRGAGAGISYLLSARNNFIDRTAQTVYPYINNGEGLPYNFLDIYGKLTASDGVNYANLFGFRHVDNVNYEFPADIGWEAVGAGANFQVLPTEAAAIISGSFAYSNYASALESQSETFPRKSSINGFNGALKVGYIFNSIDEFNFGMSVLGFTTDYIFTNSFGFQTSQQASNTEAIIYSRYKKVFLVETAGGGTYERAVIEPSLHLHYYNNQSAIRAEPRLRAKLNFPGLSFSVGTGTYSQNLVAATSDRDVVNLFQGFLSAPEELAYKQKKSTLQTGWHLLAGAEVALYQKISINLEGWYKNFTQLTNTNRDKLFQQDPDFITETGEAYGVDLVAKYRSRNLYLYGNYGLAKVTRTDRINTATPRTYPPVWDRRHTANLVVAYKSGRFEGELVGQKRIKPKFSDAPWEFSLRWSLGSGFPFTQTQAYFEKLNFFDDGAQTDISTQNGQLALILSDDLNGGRLPYYHRLDLSADRRWLIRNKVLVELNATLINTYNRDNIFYFDRVRFAPVYQFPAIPALGLTIKY
ncbi:MAG: carboxypeptidase-like regulatory domain-containing protein [Bacteroidia bacterium]|nr:carboxypeptidase-like regulatory domain-containing protein [Bacteroidia bacterium]